MLVKMKNLHVSIDWDILYHHLVHYIMIAFAYIKQKKATFKENYSF